MILLLSYYRLCLMVSILTAELHVYSIVIKFFNQKRLLEKNLKNLSYYMNELLQLFYVENDLTLVF